MAIALKNCAMCRGKLELASIEKVAGESGPLKMTVYGMPAGKCAKGHAVPVHRDFLLWLLHELRERQGGLAAAEAKGMLFKKYHCGCGAELPAQPARSATFGFDMAYPESPAFTVEIEVAVYKCPGCGKEQARSAKDVAGATPAAVAALNDAAGFPHSG